MLYIMTHKKKWLEKNELYNDTLKKKWNNNSWICYGIEIRMHNKIMHIVHIQRINLYKPVNKTDTLLVSKD